MDILYLLVPLSVVLVFLIIAMFWWALYSGQFDNVEREGERILLDETPPSPSQSSGSIPIDSGVSSSVDSHQVGPR